MESLKEKNRSARPGARLAVVRHYIPTTEKRMTKLGLFGAAAVILSSAPASPAMAQHVISDPGYCAQFYPNANCDNTGPGNPYTGDYQLRNGWGGGYGGGGGAVSGPRGGWRPRARS